MGWRFRKVWQAGPFRWALSKRGVGWSIGLPGLRYGMSPTGQRYLSAGIAGTGLYWIKYLPAKQRHQIGGTSSTPQLPTPVSSTGQIPSAPTPHTAPSGQRRWWQQKGLGP